MHIYYLIVLFMLHLSCIIWEHAWSDSSTILSCFRDFFTTLTTVLFGYMWLTYFQISQFSTEFSIWFAVLVLIVDEKVFWSSFMFYTYLDEMLKNLIYFSPVSRTVEMFTYISKLFTEHVVHNYIQGPTEEHPRCVIVHTLFF